jgi:hypothetical protein
LSILNDIFPFDYKKVDHLINTLQPIVESFFIVYNVLFSKDNVAFDSEN